MCKYEKENRKALIRASFLCEDKACAKCSAWLVGRASRLLVFIGKGYDYALMAPCLCEESGTSDVEDSRMYYADKAKCRHEDFFRFSEDYSDKHPEVWQTALEQAPGITLEVM